MAWIANSGSYPYQDALDELIPVFSEPYPTGIFRSNGGYPYLPNRSRIEVISDPLPECIFSLKSGEYPRFPRLNLIKMGALNGATTLKNVQIPQSCKSLGQYSFNGTNIEQVTISSDCTYSETTFPETCNINFYNE